MFSVYVRCLIVYQIINSRPMQILSPVPTPVQIYLPCLLLYLTLLICNLKHLLSMIIMIVWKNKITNMLILCTGIGDDVSRFAFYNHNLKRKMSILSLQMYVSTMYICFHCIEKPQKSECKYCMYRYYEFYKSGVISC